MNKLICVLAIIGITSAQTWGNNGYRDDSYHAPRRPVQPAPLAHDGRVIDTPEIANLKAAHFAAHDAAIKALPPQRGYNQEYREPDYRPQEQQRFQDYRTRDYRGPQEFNNRINDDYDDDRDSGYQGHEREEPRWRGPLAKIEFTEDGKFIKDTPEVSHARQQHLEALNAAKNSPLYQPEPPTNNYQENRYDDRRNQGYQGNQRYQVNQDYKDGGYDDGQYRPEQERVWQGPGSQYAQRPAGYYN